MGKDRKKRKQNNINSDAILSFIIAVLLMVTGILMLVFEIVKTGRHYLTQQDSAIGGTIIIMLSLLIFVVGYHSLSPFSKIREFFEKTPKTENKPKDGSIDRDILYSAI